MKETMLFTAGFALVGYAASKVGFESAPLLLGFVLGRLLEENLRRALTIARGDLSVFVHRPICAALLLTGLLVLAIAVLPAIQKSREEVFTE